MYKTLKSLITGDVSAVRSDNFYNYGNMVYIGKLYMGSNMEPLDINFDTGSHYLIAGVQINSINNGLEVLWIPN